MRTLFNLGLDKYNSLDNVIIRPSSRSIIIKDKNIALIHSLKYDYYKFPGGGIEDEESNIDALIRETQEEAGLNIIISSIKEYGLVKRIEKINDSYLVQDNYYYLCSVDNNIVNQNLDKYEDEELFTLEYVDPVIAIECNSKDNYGPKSLLMIQREKKVLELLIEEGYFN